MPSSELHRSTKEERNVGRIDLSTQENEGRLWVSENKEQIISEKTRIKREEKHILKGKIFVWAYIASNLAGIPQGEGGQRTTLKSSAHKQPVSCEKAHWQLLQNADSPLLINQPHLHIWNYDGEVKNG